MAVPTSLNEDAWSQRHTEASCTSTPRAQVEMAAEMGRAHPSPAVAPRPGTYHRRSRWGYPETLGQDACEVGGPGPVPQEPPVMQLLKRLVTLALPFALYLEDLVRGIKRREWKESPVTVGNWKIRDTGTELGHVRPSAVCKVFQSGWDVATGPTQGLVQQGPAAKIHTGYSRGTPEALYFDSLLIVLIPKLG